MNTRTTRIIMQEQNYLHAKQTIHQLECALIRIDDFPYYKWNDTLRKLQKEINDFYWNL